MTFIISSLSLLVSGFVKKSFNFCINPWFNALTIWNITNQITSKNETLFWKHLKWILLFLELLTLPYLKKSLKSPLLYISLVHHIYNPTAPHSVWCNNCNSFYWETNWKQDYMSTFYWKFIFGFTFRSCLPKENQM